MNLKALDIIVQDNVEILENSARENGVDEGTVIGIAKYAISNGYEQLSQKQKYHFDNMIRPLIEDVRCPGYTHEFEEEPYDCPNYIDEDDLVEYYSDFDNNTYCESCAGQAASDAHSKSKFFKD